MFLLRPIEQATPYLFVDTSYYKVRDGAQYVTKAVLVVAGVREDGYWEILGARVAECENGGFWSGLFRNEESPLWLVGSILMDVNKGWVTGRWYLTVGKE
jgi:putative transposase